MDQVGGPFCGPRLASRCCVPARPHNRRPSAREMRHSPDYRGSQGCAGGLLPSASTPVSFSPAGDLATPSCLTAMRDDAAFLPVTTPRHAQHARAACPDGCEHYAFSAHSLIAGRRKRTCPCEWRPAPGDRLRVLTFRRDPPSITDAIRDLTSVPCGKPTRAALRRATLAADQEPVAVLRIPDPVRRTAPARPGGSGLRVTVSGRRAAFGGLPRPAPHASEDVLLREPVIGDLGPDVREHLLKLCRPGRRRLRLKRGHLFLQLPVCRQD